jgi:hypothetical protein
MTMAAIRACLRSVVAALVALSSTASLPAWAQDAATRLQVAALVQAGDLLLEEAAVLEPATRAIDEQGERLAQEEKRLNAEVGALEKELGQYNSEVKDLVVAAAAQRARCTGTSPDGRHAQACNDEGAKIGADAALLERRRVALAERQQQMNRHIERHNAERLVWNERKGRHDERRAVHESDVRRWLERATGVWSTDAFAELSRATGSPEPCSAGRLSGLGSMRPVDALKRMLQCLKAVRV